MISSREGCEYWLVGWDFRTFRGVSDVGAVYLLQDFMANSYEPDKIAILLDTDEGRKPCDFPFYRPGLFLASAEATKALLSLFERTCIFIPTAVDSHEYCIINCTKVLDGFDEARSEVSRYKDGAIKRVKQNVVQPHFTSLHDVFRLRGDPPVSHQVFVSARFKAAYMAAGLTGLLFRPVLSKLAAIS